MKYAIKRANGDWWTGYAFVAKVARVTDAEWWSRRAILRATWTHPAAPRVMQKRFGGKVVRLLSPAEAKRKFAATELREMATHIEATSAWSAAELRWWADELWSAKGGVK